MRTHNPLKGITLTYEDGTTRELLHPEAAGEQLTHRELALDIVQALFDQGHQGTWLALRQLSECAEARYRDEVNEWVEQRGITPTPVNPNIFIDLPIFGCMAIDDRTLEIGLRPFNATFTPEQLALTEEEQWAVVVVNLLCAGLPLLMYRDDLSESFSTGRIAALHVVFGRLCYQDGRSVPMPHPVHGHNVVAILTDEFHRLYS